MEAMLYVIEGDGEGGANWVLILRHHTFDGSIAKDRFEWEKQGHVIATFEKRINAEKARSRFLRMMKELV